MAGATIPTVFTLVAASKVHSASPSPFVNTSGVVISVVGLLQ